MGGDLTTASGQMLAAAANQIGSSHSMLTQLRSGLKHYYQWQDRNDAPLQAVRVPPAPELVNQSLEVEEAKALVETARGWWPKGGMVLLGMYLALRRFEIAKAEWSRFDENLEWYTVTGKREKTATLPVHPVLRGEFAPRRRDGFIFPGRFGGGVNPATVATWTGEVAEAAGFGHVRTHQLRHTSLTTALDNTENLRAVMEFARTRSLRRPLATPGPPKNSCGRSLTRWSSRNLSQRPRRLTLVCETPVCSVEAPGIQPRPLLILSLGLSQATVTIATHSHSGLEGK